MQLVVEATADTLAPSVDQFAVSPVSRALGGSFTISYTVSDTGGSSLNRVELQRAPCWTSAKWDCFGNGEIRLV